MTLDPTGTPTSDELAELLDTLREARDSWSARVERDRREHANVPRTASIHSLRARRLANQRETAAAYARDHAERLRELRDDQDEEDEATKERGRQLHRSWIEATSKGIAGSQDHVCMGRLACPLCNPHAARCAREEILARRTLRRSASEHGRSTMPKRNERSEGGKGR